MRRNRAEQEAYEKVLREHVHAVALKKWPFHYHCGYWDKHKPDAHGREYTIHLNKTRGVACGKVTLIVDDVSV